jgi:hypothetical protein
MPKPNGGDPLLCGHGMNAGWSLVASSDRKSASAPDQILGRHSPENAPLEPAAFSVGIISKRRPAKAIHETNLRQQTARFDAVEFEMPSNLGLNKGRARS